METCRGFAPENAADSNPAAEATPYIISVSHGYCAYCISPWHELPSAVYACAAATHFALCLTALRAHSLPSLPTILQKQRVGIY
jgi:hypothetical protein